MSIAKKRFIKAKVSVLDLINATVLLGSFAFAYMGALGPNLAKREMAPDALGIFSGMNYDAMMITGLVGIAASIVIGIVDKRLELAGRH